MWTSGSRYQCSCGTPRRIASMYWCRHCYMLKCQRCVLQEVDSYFCPSCLDEHMPSTEAKLNRNRCSRCSSCPMCGNTLSTVEAPPPGMSAEDAKLEENRSKFVTYLSCGFCQWTSHMCGLAGDKAEVMRGLREVQKGPDADYMAKLVEHYKRVAEAEVRAVDAKRKSATVSYRKSRFSYLHRAATIITRSQSQEKTRERRNKRFDQVRNEWLDIAPDALGPLRSHAVASVPALPASAFTETLDYSMTATLQQSLEQRAIQPRLVKDLMPVPKHLLAKRSKRCKSCHHNLIKPELSPTSIKYKMQLFALHNIPNIRVHDVAPLKLGQESRVVVSITNPLDQPVTLTFAKPVSNSNLVLTGTEGSHETEVTETVVEGATVTTTTVTSTVVMTSKPASPKKGDGKEVEEEEDFPPFDYNADFALPPMSITVKEHDPVQEISSIDEGAGDEFQDDPQYVAARQGNVVHILVPTTPKIAGEPVTVAMVVAYPYKNTTPALRATESGEETVHNITLCVQLNLGEAEA